MPKSGKASVSVVGSGSECFVVISIPGHGVFERAGPMDEDAAREVAKEERELMQAAFSEASKTDNDRRYDTIWAIVVLILGLMAVASYISD